MPTEIDSLQIKIESQSSGAAQRIDELVASLNKLKGTSGVDTVSSSLKKLSASLKSFETSSTGMNKLSAALTGLKGKLAGLTIIGKKAFSAVSGWVNETNSYVENINLFTVSMGEYADEAMEYAEAVHEAMGVDISEFIRNQGIFMSMATGFGLAADQAYEMSKGLTELSYDLSSFFNISLDAIGDGAFAKVQSGIAGELEPLRRLGFALSEASLQQVAYNHGINLSVREMTEAQKATLRYTAMVEQAADMGAIGDLSRTLVTPANAMRILQQQFKELRRELGSLFIPIIMKVIPYVQAFVRVLTDAAHALAAIIGFTLPAIDYSGLEGVGSSAGSATEGLDAATESAKELKSQMTGIDELNVISQDTGKQGVSTGNGYASDLGLDVSSIWDESIFKNIESQVDELIPKMKDLAIVIGTVATVWAGIKIGTWITTVAGIISGSAFIGDFKAFVDLLREGSGFLPTFSAAFPKLSGILTTLGGGSLATGLAAAAGIIVAIGSAIYYVVENFDAVKRIAQEFFEQQIAPKIETIKESFQHMGEVLQPIADFFSPIIDAVGRFITETLGIKSISDIFEFIGGVVFHTFASIVAGVFNGAVSIIQGFVSVIEGIVDIVAGVVGAVVGLFSGDLNAAWESVVQIGEGIWKVFKGLWDITVGAVIEFVEGVCGWFRALWDELVGHSIVPDTINAIVEWFASLPGKILSGLKQFCDDVAQKFMDLWNTVKAWFAENVKPKFTKEYWVKMLDGLKTGVASILEAVRTTFVNKWNAIKTWWTASVAPKFTKDYWISKLDGLKSGVASALDSVRTTLSEKWNSIKSWWSASIAPKFTKAYWTDVFAGIKEGLVDTFKNAINVAIDKMNQFIGWINDKMSFTVPGFTIFDGASLDVPEWLGGGSVSIPSIGWGSKNVTLMSLPTISKFADGGFIEDGLFTMNQGEIAGRFNNGKSVVANNEQIIAGISEGVYSAVVAAMGNGGSRESQSINVYLDGKQIYSSVKKTESERGKQIFGNQLGYGY